MCLVQTGKVQGNAQQALQAVGSLVLWSVDAESAKSVKQGGTLLLAPTGAKIGSLTSPIQRVARVVTPPTRLDGYGSRLWDAASDTTSKNRNADVWSYFFLMRITVDLNAAPVDKRSMLPYASQMKPGHRTSIEETNRGWNCVGTVIPLEHRVLAEVALLGVAHEHSQPTPPPTD